MVKILVFDTETTGLPPKMPGSTWAERDSFDKSLLSLEGLHTSWQSIKDMWPSIIQLSYICYNTEDSRNAKIFNKYIDIPDNIVITEDSIKIHHITREKIASVPPENRGTIQDALNEFLDDVKKSDIIVGHNVQFDRKMIVSELLRLSVEEKLPQIQDMMNDANFECTMIETTPICNLKTKQTYIDKITGIPKSFYKIKSPKLSEAYKYFFGYQPAEEKLHDALIDTVICLRVFCKYKYEIDICGQNETITDYIMDISPQGYTCIEMEAGEILSRAKKRKNLKKSKKSKKHRRSKKRRKSKKV